MHTDWEIEKWKGMSRPCPEKGKTLDPNLKKHQVISDLLLHGISTMIPTTVGPWGDLGPMLKMLLYGSFPSQVNYMRRIARQRKCIASTKEAIMTARKSTSPTTCGRTWMASTIWSVLVWPHISGHVPTSIGTGKYWSISHSGTSPPDCHRCH